MTLRAIPFEDRARHRAEAVPGSVWLPEIDPGAQGALWFWCPCGCGALARITVGAGHKPTLHGPTWHWDGNRHSPTLSPSVHQLSCGWHGWLRAGYWESV